VIKSVLELYAATCAFATIAYAVWGWMSRGKADVDELEIREFDEFWYRRSVGVTDDAVSPPHDEDCWNGGDLIAPLAAGNKTPPLPERSSTLFRASGERLGTSESLIARRY
jgi:hypothetical protein